VKTFVLLPIIDVKARIVVFCTPATGTPESGKSTPMVHIKFTGRSDIGALLVGSAARSDSGYTSPLDSSTYTQVVNSEL
jgi:hypothetical protein